MGSFALIVTQTGPALLGDGADPAHALEVEQAEDALRDVLTQIREDHDADKRQRQHARKKGAQILSVSLIIDYSIFTFFFSSRCK